MLIRLLPALPGIWAEYGFASGLKARGGYVVSLVWRDGKIEKYGNRAAIRPDTSWKRR